MGWEKVAKDVTSMGLIGLSRKERSALEQCKYKKVNRKKK